MPGPTSQPAYQNIPSVSHATWSNPMAGGSYAPWGHNPYMPWGSNVPMGMGMPWANYMQGGGSFPGFPFYPGGPSQSQVGQFGTASAGNQNVYGGCLEDLNLPAQHRKGSQFSVSRLFWQL